MPWTAGHADRFQVRIKIQLGVAAEVPDVEFVHDQGPVENGKPRVVREREVSALRVNFICTGPPIRP